MGSWAGWWVGEGDHHSQPDSATWWGGTKLGTQSGTHKGLACLGCPGGCGGPERHPACPRLREAAPEAKALGPDATTLCSAVNN